MYVYSSSKITCTRVRTCSSVHVCASMRKWVSVWMHACAWSVQSYHQRYEWESCQSLGEGGGAESVKLLNPMRVLTQYIIDTIAAIRMIRSGPILWSVSTNSGKEMISLSDTQPGYHPHQMKINFSTSSPFSYLPWQQVRSPATEHQNSKMGSKDPPFSGHIFMCQG